MLKKIHNTMPTITKPRGLGDVVAAVAQPIAKGLDAIFQTKIADCDGCKARRTQLNQKFPL
jgi:hypothetical protein